MDIFLADRDYRLYLRWLGQAAAKHGVDIHAYVLMTNHVHLLASPGTEHGVPRMLQSLGRRYVRYFNTANQRSGTLWEGRYRASVVDTDAYMHVCARYIELNPVRAGIVRRPGDYRWSSFRCNAEGVKDRLVTPHDLYCSLGSTAELRRQAYLGLFEMELSAPTLEHLRGATNGGWAIGDDDFRDRIATATGRRAAPHTRGRPRRKPAAPDWS